MRLSKVNFNEEINFSSFIDELDRFDEFDIDVLSRHYDQKYESKNKIKDIEETV